MFSAVTSLLSGFGTVHHRVGEWAVDHTLAPQDVERAFPRREANEEECSQACGERAKVRFRFGLSLFRRRRGWRRRGGRRAGGRRRRWLLRHRGCLRRSRR